MKIFKIMNREGLFATIVGNGVKWSNKGDIWINKNTITLHLKAKRKAYALHYDGAKIVEYSLKLENTKDIDKFMKGEYN